MPVAKGGNGHMIEAVTVHICKIPLAANVCAVSSLVVTAVSSRRCIIYAGNGYCCRVFDLLRAI